MFVELETRHGDGLTVTLEWDRATGQTQIVVHDARSTDWSPSGFRPPTRPTRSATPSGTHHECDHPACRAASTGGPPVCGRPEPADGVRSSGGASLGALQVGMLEALYEQGITPDFLVGTSVGALNAAFVASRPQSPQPAGELGRVWRELQRQDVFPLSMSALVGGVCGRRDHLVPDRELRRLIRRYIQFDDLADAAIPLHLVAFDLIEGRERLLSEGPAVECIAASASIPGSFPRWRSVSTG